MTRCETSCRCASNWPACGERSTPCIDQHVALGCYQFPKVNANYIQYVKSLYRGTLRIECRQVRRMLCSPIPTTRTSVTGSLGRGRLCTFVFGRYVTGCVMWLEETRSSEEEEEERGGRGGGGGGGIWELRGLTVQSWPYFLAL
jgi:hypothetical protein